MPDEYTATSGAVKCEHAWELVANDGHVREYHCNRCGLDAYQEEAHAGS